MSDGAAEKVAALRELAARNETYSTEAGLAADHIQELRAALDSLFGAHWRLLFLSPANPERFR